VSGVERSGGEAAHDDVALGSSRIRVTHGGMPDPEQLAALTVVLTAVRGAHATPTEPPTPPAWAQAALLEGIGARIVEEPAHLRSLHAVT
jgi:hypothetical protein